MLWLCTVQFTYTGKLCRPASVSRYKMEVIQSRNIYIPPPQMELLLISYTDIIIIVPSLKMLILSIDRSLALCKQSNSVADDGGPLVKLTS